VLIFRFSALTYKQRTASNYDRDYSRDSECYLRLLHHGPLQALSMAEAARAAGHCGEQDRPPGLRLPADF